MSESESDNIDIIINQNENENKNKFHTITSYFILLCLIILFQSMITSAYLSSIISSIENYYGYSTELIGIILSSYDIISIISIPLFSYFGTKYNRAKLLSFGSFLFSLGNFIFIIPYFIYGYKYNSINSTIDSFCYLNQTNEMNFHSNSFSYSYYLIILSMIIMSIGTSPFYTIGITYLTDHLKKEDQSIYTSILYGMVALGPAIGFLMASYFLSKWINISDDIHLLNINSNDPRWIGRWWAGFIISSSFLFLFSILLFTFPSHLNQFSSNQQINSTIHFKDFLKILLNLFRNLPYITISIINSIENILVVLFTTYLIKYIETVYNLSSSYSSILTGLILVPSAILGTISGGYLIRRLNLSINGCMKLIFISCLITLISLLIILFIKCPTNIPYSFDTTCSQMCHCSSMIYEPVCYHNQLNYLSPCYAGCTDKNQTSFLNCQCLLNGTEVEKGLCKNNCNLELILLFVLLFFVIYFETLMATPQLMIILRILDESIQSIGLALQNSLLKIISQIPTPILFGILIDKQCLYWSKSYFQEKTSCLIYDEKQFSFLFFLTILLIKFISFSFISFLCFFFHKKQRNLSLENNENEHLLNNEI
ncbi:hypothetical protein I4U23_031293 [Adineta vaga]|nr:hypothetical protein I4U23_031293 [Adineta vaga]